MCIRDRNNTGYGTGFRFGYYDGNMDFVELGRTEKDIDQVAVLKTQNLYYGRDASLGKTTYSSSITSNIAVGCYHILIDSGYGDYEDARRDAEDYEDGFVAWIDEEYQVRVGAYLSKGEALDAIDTLGEGTVVGTTSYGMSSVETGTDHIPVSYTHLDVYKRQRFSSSMDCWSPLSTASVRQWSM